MKRDCRLYIDDILEAIGKIEEYVKGLTFDEFSEDSKLIDAVIRNFEAVGETAKNIAGEMREKYQNVPLEEMAGMLTSLFMSILA